MAVVNMAHIIRKSYKQRLSKSIQDTDFIPMSILPNYIDCLSLPVISNTYNCNTDDGRTDNGQILTSAVYVVMGTWFALIILPCVVSIQY